MSFRIAQVDWSDMLRMQRRRGDLAREMPTCLTNSRRPSPQLSQAGSALFSSCAMLTPWQNDPTESPEHTGQLAHRTCVLKGVAGLQPASRALMSRLSRAVRCSASGVLQAAQAYSGHRPAR
jgi:hypothetical protein